MAPVDLGMLKKLDSDCDNYWGYHAEPKTAVAHVTVPWNIKVCVTCLIYTFQVMRGMRLIMQATELPGIIVEAPKPSPVSVSDTP